MIAHCMPLLDRPRSCWIVGAAIDTMVWSMKVIATAKIIAVRIRLFERPPMRDASAMTTPSCVTVRAAIVQEGMVSCGIYGPAIQLARRRAGSSLAGGGCAAV